MRDAYNKFKNYVTNVLNGISPKHRPEGGYSLVGQLKASEEAHMGEIYAKEEALASANSGDLQNMIDAYRSELSRTRKFFNSIGISPETTMVVAARRVLRERRKSKDITSCFD